MGSSCFTDRANTKKLGPEQRQLLKLIEFMQGTMADNKARGWKATPPEPEATTFKIPRFSEPVNIFKNPIMNQKWMNQRWREKYRLDLDLTDEEENELRKSTLSYQDQLADLQNIINRGLERVSRDNEKIASFKDILKEEAMKAQQKKDEEADERFQEAEKKKEKAQQEKVRVKEETKELGAFVKLGLDPAILAPLSQLNITTPTPIQETAIPQLIQGGDCIISSETGSGKTLSFLLPTIHKLKAEEKKGPIQYKEYSPRALILVPNKDLADQIDNVLTQFSVTMPMEHSVIAAARSQKKQESIIGRAPDIVIATPARALQHYKHKTLQLSEVQTVILDEIDTLLNEKFFQPLLEVITPLRNAKTQGRSIQFMFASATVTKDSIRTIRHLFPSIEQILTATRHVAVSKLKQIFLDINEHRKAALLLKILRDPSEGPAKSENAAKVSSADDDQGPPSGNHILIFCSTVHRCDTLVSFLLSKGISAAPFHGAILPKPRAKNYQKFLKGDISILVSTDIGSRGLDTVMVKHVILYDFVSNGLEYLRKVGRTARAGTEGCATSFISTPQEDALAKAIQKANLEGSSLESLVDLSKPVETRKSKKHAPLIEKSSKKGVFAVKKKPKRST